MRNIQFAQIGSRPPEGARPLPRRTGDVMVQAPPPPTPPPPLPAKPAARPR